MHPVTIAIASFAVLFATRWPLHARYLYDWDAGQYALGAARFDIYAHRPHPPGYPLWILLVKLLGRTGLDANESQIVLALAFASIAVAAFVALARRHVSERTAWVLGAALVFAPGAMLATCVASTYAVDLATSAVLAGLAAKAWEGDKRAATIGALVAGLLLGVRASGVALMGPLLLLAAARANRRDPRAWARTVAAFVVPVLAWFVPVARMHGGARRLLAFALSSGSAPFRDGSMLYGARASAHALMIRDALVWTLFDVGAVLLLVFFATRVRTDEGAPNASLDRVFLAAWLVPVAILVLGIHAPKPGYVLLALPPLLILCARPIDRMLAGSPLRTAAAAAFVLVFDSVLAMVPRRDGVIDRTSLASVRTADAETGAVVQAMTAGILSPDQSLLVFLGGSWYGPNERNLPAHLPASTLWTFIEGKMVDISATPRETDPNGELPESLRRVVFLLPSGAADTVVTNAFPGAQTIFRGPYHQVVVWSPGSRTIAPTLHWNGYDYSMIHGVPHAKLPHAWAVGFEDVERDGPTEFIWADGPRAELSFTLRDAAPTTVTFLVGATIFPETKVTLEANGAPLGARAVSRGDVVTLRFAAHKGVNTVALGFDRWNGHPDKPEAEDDRPLAISLDRVTIESGSVPYLLLPTPH